MDERIGGELLKGHIATLVLSVLSAQPRHGYEVMKILAERSQGVFDLGQGTIYPLLYSLEEQGLVKSHEATVEGRRRRVYSITSAGRKSLGQRRETWRAFQIAINGVLGGTIVEGQNYAAV